MANEELYSLVDVLLGSDSIFGLMVLGEAGIGKTYSVLQYLKENKVAYTMMKTYSTPFSLYVWLYTHRNDNLIVLDDVDGLWENDHSAAILKSALWEDDGERSVEWHSTSSKFEKLGIPSEYTLSAKIIFICNKTRENPHVDAVLSRILHYKFTYNREEKIKVMEEIAEKEKRFNLTKKERLEVVKLIDVNASIFDFRTLVQGLAIMEQSKINGSDWKATFLSILQGEVNKELRFVYNLSKKGYSVEEQAQEYISTFGKSRRTFFYLREKLRESGCLE